MQQINLRASHKMVDALTAMSAARATPTLLFLDNSVIHAAKEDALGTEVHTASGLIMDVVLNLQFIVDWKDLMLDRDMIIENQRHNTHHLIANSARQDLNQVIIAALKKKDDVDVRI